MCRPYTPRTTTTGASTRVMVVEGRVVTPPESLGVRLSSDRGTRDGGCICRSIDVIVVLDEDPEILNVSRKGVSYHLYF